MKVNNFVYSSGLEAAKNRRQSVDARPPREEVIPSGGALLLGVAIFRYNPPSVLWK